MIPTEASLLCLYMNASHHWQGKPLYRAAVETARSLPTAGASVFLVDLSFGAHRTIRDAKSEYAFVDVPVVMEVVDAPEKVEALVAALATMVVDGLVTVEPVRVVRYAQHEEPAAPAAAPTSAADAVSSGGAPDMALEGDAQKVTIYISSSDAWRGRNLAAAIVEACRKKGLAGATASLGVLGFGKHSVVHRSHLFGLSDGLPEKIEIVDRPERIAEILPTLEEMVEGGLIVVQDVRVVRYSHQASPKP